MSAAPVNGGVLKAMSLELGRLQNIVGLCAFAADARRIQNEIESASFTDATLRDRLFLMVHGHRNWEIMPDTLADVLVDVHDRLAELEGLMCGKPAGADMVIPPQP